MRKITIGNQELNIKDYYCSFDDTYLDRADGKLWLYVNITDVCNGTCPFCINHCVKEGRSTINPEYYRNILERIKEYIYGVSFTGGEPMLYPDLVNEIIGITEEICGSHVEKDIVTNGTGFERIIDTLKLEYLDSVHLSRHMISDIDNNSVFGLQTVSSDSIAKVIAKMDDPAQIVINCVLMKDGIDSVEAIAQFLEFAADLGIRNVSFIGMSRHNTFTEKYYIDPVQLDIYSDTRFHRWNEFKDHKYCCCSTGSYDAKKRSIRFYYRGIGTEKAPYARQLVYTADDRLLAGFGGKEIRFD